MFLDADNNNNKNAKWGGHALRSSSESLFFIRFIATDEIINAENKTNLKCRRGIDLYY